MPDTRRGPLPLDEEDLAPPPSVAERHPRHGRGVISPVTLFFVVVLAAPVAALLSVVAVDAYRGAMGPVEVTEPRAALAPPETPPDATAAAAPDGLKKLVAALEGSNDQLARAVKEQADATAALAKAVKAQAAALDADAKGRDAQTAALTKLAEKAPGDVKVEVKAPPAKLPPIVVVKVPARETFDLAYERRKILELAGIDIDDPVESAAPFEAIRSRDVLTELIASLDAIIGAGRTHPEVGDFLRDNALRAKKYAVARQAALR